MTSNVGTRQLKEFGHGVGFAQPSQNSDEYAHNVIQKALSKTFSPEFLNRVDDVIIFDQASRESIFKIIDLELEQLYKRIGNLGFRIELTEAAKNFLADKGYDVQYGARPLKRAIQNHLEDVLAERLLQGDVKARRCVACRFRCRSAKIDFQTDRKLTFCQFLAQKCASLGWQTF